MKNHRVESAKLSLFARNAASFATTRATTIAGVIACATFFGCASTQVSHSAGAIKGTNKLAAPAENAEANPAPDQSPRLDEPLTPHDQLWSLLHFGNEKIPLAMGDLARVAEVGVVFNANGEVSSFIDFEACLHNKKLETCEAHEKMGVLQNMKGLPRKQRGDPTLRPLMFDDLAVAGQALMIFAIPASVEMDLRQNWKVIATTGETQSWSTLVQALIHFGAASKFQNFAPFDYAEGRFVKMLKRWNPKVEIPQTWEWHERLSIFIDPAWGASAPLSAENKSWIRRTLQSPIWIWKGLVERASRHMDDMSFESALGIKDHLQAIRAFENMRTAKVDRKALKDQELLIHKYQTKILGSPNCWNRVRVTFRHFSQDAHNNHIITDANFDLLNGKAKPKKIAKVLATLAPESSEAAALNLDIELYREDETRSPSFQFDSAWSSWLAGLKSHGVMLPEETSMSPLLDCTQKYDK